MSHRTVEDAVAALTPAFWAAPETSQAILARLPEYRLSKFQDALPDAYATEMVGAYLLDTGAAARLSVNRS